MNDDYEQLRAELEELKTWVADACEVLREAEFDTRTETYDRAVALLRRAENP